MLGLSCANLNHNLKLWTWAMGEGRLQGASALAWHREGGEAEWSTFPVHKVNVSDSGVVKDTERQMTRVTPEERLCDQTLKMPHGLHFLFISCHPDHKIIYCVSFWDYYQISVL